MLLRLLRNVRERRAQVSRDTTNLTRWMGEDAGYAEARTRARECRGRKDGAGDRHWSKVAVEIARRTGYVIGERVEDRYAADANSLRPAGHLSRTQVDALVDIAQAVADLANGKGNATSVQNVAAWVEQVVEATGSRPEIALAGAEVVRACETLAASDAECRASLKVGAYPVAADRAGQKLQAFKASLQAAR